MSNILQFGFALGVLFLPASLAAADKTPVADYIKVEVRGTLDHGVVAIGGESTGTVIHVGKVTWELDLGGNVELETLAQKLNKKTVLVTGEYLQKQGVEIPVRQIVKVVTLKDAPSK